MPTKLPKHTVEAYQLVKCIELRLEGDPRMFRIDVLREALHDADVFDAKVYVESAEGGAVWQRFDAIGVVRATKTADGALDEALMMLGRAIAGPS